jgi:hypothetical protein
MDVAVFDQNGNKAGDTLPVKLGADQQLARFLHQDRPILQFKGSMVLSCCDPGGFVTVGLVQNQGRLTVIPVQPAIVPGLQH